MKEILRQKNTWQLAQPVRERNSRFTTARPASALMGRRITPEVALSEKVAEAITYAFISPLESLDVSPRSNPYMILGAHRSPTFQKLIESATDFEEVREMIDELNEGNPSVKEFEARAVIMLEERLSLPAVEKRVDANASFSVALFAKSFVLTLQTIVLDCLRKFRKYEDDQKELYENDRKLDDQAARKRAARKLAEERREAKRGVDKRDHTQYETRKETRKNDLQAELVISKQVPLTQPSRPIVVNARLILE